MGPNVTEVGPKGCFQGYTIVDDGKLVVADFEVVQAAAEFGLEAARGFQRNFGLATLSEFALKAGLCVVPWRVKWSGWKVHEHRWVTRSQVLLV